MAFVKLTCGFSFKEKEILVVLIVKLCLLCNYCASQSWYK